MQVFLTLFLISIPFFFSFSSPFLFHPFLFISCLLACFLLLLPIFWILLPHSICNFHLTKWIIKKATSGPVRHLSYHLILHQMPWVYLVILLHNLVNCMSWDIFGDHMTTSKLTNENKLIAWLGDRGTKETQNLLLISFSFASVLSHSPYFLFNSFSNLISVGLF